MTQYAVKMLCHKGDTAAIVLFAKDRDDAIEFVKRTYRRVCKKILSARKHKAAA